MGSVSKMGRTSSLTTLFGPSPGSKLQCVHGDEVMQLRATSEGHFHGLLEVHTESKEIPLNLGGELECLR